MTENFEIPIVKDMTRVYYNRIDKKFGYFLIFFLVSLIYNYKEHYVY